MPSIAAPTSSHSKLRASEITSRPSAVNKRARGQRKRRGPTVGDITDDGLKHRRRQLIRQRDPAQLRERQMMARLERGVRALQQRLHRVVQQMAETDRDDDGESGLVPPTGRITSLGRRVQTDAPNRKSHRTALSGGGSGHSVRSPRRGVPNKIDTFRRETDNSDLLAQQMQDDFAPMGLLAMLEQVNALPGAERRLAIEHRDG